MEKKVRRPIVFVVLAVLLALAAYFFRDKIFQTDGKNPDVKNRPDLKNPEIKLPERFKWEQYVTREPKLMLPVRMVQDVRRSPLRVETACAVLNDQLQPVIHVTFETPRERADIRVDATLLYQGFEKNRYTVVYPIKERQRFMVSAQSAMMADTASMAVLGASQFPVLSGYRLEAAVFNVSSDGVPGVLPQIDDPKVGRPKTRDPKREDPQPGDGQAVNPGEKSYRHHFQLGELSNGTAYHVRVCELIDNVWVATQEAAITTPFCPLDEKLSPR